MNEQIEEMEEDLRYCHTEFVGNYGDVYTDYRKTAEKLVVMGYRKQSENMVEVVRCCDCQYCEILIEGITEEPRYFCTRKDDIGVGVDPTDYCSLAKMKGGAE